MYNFSLTHGIGPGERNDRHDLAGFGKELERATGLDPWLPHAWPMAAFPEAHTSDGYMPGFGGAVRGFQIFAGLDPDGVARSGGPTENALAATLDPARRGRTVTADEVYRGAPSAAATVPTDRPADGGVKAAAKIRKLSQQTAGPGATGAGKGGAGANRRPTIPTVPPPGVRRSVGAGGVNDQGDLLQARRNLARVGFAPRIRGIGEPDGGLAAVQNGLRAYQQARGIKVDGLMNPGGATEQALHAQIGRQQKRLIEQVATDAAEAAAKLSAGGWSGNAGAIGGPESVAARTLGARMSGAKVEAQQREAYAEALDRMKRAGAQAGKGAEAGAAAGKGRQADATGGVQAERADRSAEKLRPAGGHPLTHKQPAHAAQRAAAREAAAQRAKEAAEKAAYDADQVKSNGLLRNRIGVDAPSLTPEQKRKLALDVAAESGSLPSASTGWFDDLGQAVERAQARSLPGAGDTAHDAQDRRTLLEGYAYLERINALVREKPHYWLGVTPRWRALAGVVASLEKGGRPNTDAERVALMVRAGRRLDDLYRKSRGEHLRLVGELIGFVPGPGEALALVQGVDALLDGERAAAAGRTGEAEQHRVQAAILFATAVPGAGRLVRLLHKTAKSLGAKTGRSLTALAERVKKRGRMKEGSESGSASPARNEKAASGGEKGDGRTDNSPGDASSPKPGDVPKDTILKLERWGYRIPGLDKAVSQRVVARMMEAKRTVGKNPKFDNIFREVVRDLPDDIQDKMRASFSNYLGAAGEKNLVFLLTKSGAKKVERTSRRFNVNDTTFAFDVLTDSALQVRRGPLGKRAVPVRKASGMKTGTDSKLGPNSDPSTNQRKAHVDINENEKVAKSVTKDVPVDVDEAAFLRQDFRELHLPAIQEGFRESLLDQKLLTVAQVEQVMQNLAAYHKLSKSGVSVTAGEVVAFTIVSVAMMKALEDGME